MPLELITVPCLSDNYAFILGDRSSMQAAVVDVPDAPPINTILKDQGWELTDVILTHHHPDHVQGLQQLDGVKQARVIGAAADEHRLPPLTEKVGDGDVIRVLGEDAHVLDVSGHTIGHIALHLPASGVAFTADSLMAMGCGRLFEGTAELMWSSLLKLRDLPPDTLICSGHEYTAANARFAQSLEEDNPALTSRIVAIEEDRKAERPTVPSRLELEIATNPFLRADEPSLMAAVGMSDARPVDVFAEIRGRKDRF